MLTVCGTLDCGRATGARESTNRQMLSLVFIVLSRILQVGPRLEGANSGAAKGRCGCGTGRPWERNGLLPQAGPDQAGLAQPQTLPASDIRRQQPPSAA